MNLTKAQQAVLNDCFLFQSLTEPERKSVFQTLAVQSFGRGESIYTQHEFRRSLGIILEGEAAVLKESNTLLNLLRPGSCFGAAALFAPTKEYVTNIVARKTTKAVFFSDEELTRLFRAYPDMALSYITFLSGRIQFLNRKIDSFTTNSAEDAVWRWLTAHGDAEGIVMVEGGLARLARELSIGRATLYRSLTQLETDGRIVKDGARIMIQEDWRTL